MKKANINIPMQSTIGLIAGAVIIVLIIFIFMVPAIKFFNQQALNTKMEKSLENLKETIKHPGEIMIDARGYSLFIFGKQDVCIIAARPEKCNEKNCICACKIKRYNFYTKDVYYESCIDGQCIEIEEDIKIDQNCGLILNNEFKNLLVEKKDNIVSINKK